ncbi:MAG: 30S ribosomal protein S18 [Omnitrophica bacterium]|nr:30S ribosomal protein S18 [Candidatus Omnitrophota bacterium]
MFDKKIRENKNRGIVRRGVGFKKDCIFCKKNLEIDYKNTELLSRYVSARGKILSRRISGNCAKHQRKVAREIKRARFLNLISYVGGMAR